MQKYLLFVIIFIAATFSFPLAAATDMPIATDLEKDGKQAKQLNQPIAILLVFKGLRSASDLKEEAIYPNLLSGVFDDKVIFREIQVNQEGKTIDFYGEPLENAEFRELFNITSLPAMVFVDSEGNQLTSPLFAGNYEYYGFYLKRKLNEAMKALDNPTRFE